MNQFSLISNDENYKIFNLNNMKHIFAYQTVSQLNRSKGGLKVIARTVLLLSFILFCPNYFIHAENSNPRNFLFNIESDNNSVKSVLNQIEQQSDYKFFYNNNKIDTDCKVSISVKKKNIYQVLNLVFKNRGVNYSIKKNTIVLSNEEESKQPVKKIISGTIKDSNGEVIIGARIVSKGHTNKGTISDVNGHFSLQSFSNQMLISYMGYITKTITLKEGISAYDIVLKEDNKVLDDVVVIGYGSQKKVNLTGSVASISTDKIKDRVQTNVVSALQGTVPGVTVISRPGKTPSINFRGRGNLGVSEPLYVIDGAIASASFFSNLDSNSIKTISFLKDAASSAIYGSRAAYGVVLVTTKKGSNKKMDVSYNGYVALNNPTYTPDYVNSSDYATLYNEALYNSNPSGGKYQGYSQDEIGWFKDGSKPDLYPNTNWEDLIIKKDVVTTQHSLNFSGGNNKVKFFTGLGYLYKDNMIPGRNSNRYNLNTNITSDLTNWLSINTGIKFIQNKSDVNQGTPSLAYFSIVPSTFVAKQSNGNWGTINGGKVASTNFINGNPLRALSKKNWSKSKTKNTMFDLGFNLKPIEGLSIKGQGVYQNYEYKGQSYTALQGNAINFLSGDEIGGTGVTKNKMSMNWASSTRKLYTATAKYNFALNQHSFDLLLGTSYEHYKYENLGASRGDFPADSFTGLDAGSTSGPNYKNSGSSTENKMLSYFGRINYNLMQRYLFEMNLRADASSRFHKDKRWGYFPSFSAAWRINEESFMQDIDWLDNLKVRASYGTLGNINNVGNYDYFQNYSANANYNFDDSAVKGVKESKPANIELGWEKVSLTDFGVDADILNGKLNIVADYYIKNTSDILLVYNVPLETGITANPAQNIGKIKNTGFELALNHRNTIGGVTYSIGANIATNHNEIIDMGTSNNKIENSGHIIKYILKEGESIGSFYGYKTDGLYSQNDIDKGNYYLLNNLKPNAGDIKFLPQREDIEYKENITAEDKTIIGNDVPDFTYGLNVNIQYHNFEFSMFGQGVSGTQVAFDVYGMHPFFHGMDNPRAFHMNRWTEENPNQYAAYPRIYSTSDQHTIYNRNFNDQHLFDADYFRFKTLTLGYKVPNEKIKDMGISALKFYITGENLMTLRADNKIKDFDPETAGSVIYTLGVKSIAFGVNVSF